MSEGAPTSTQWLRQAAADHVPHATWGDPLDGAELDQEAGGTHSFWQAWAAGVAIVGYIGDSIPKLR